MHSNRFVSRRTVVRLVGALSAAVILAAGNAVRPTLEKNGSAEVTAVLPSGRQEVIAWIRDFDPDYATTYWLRRPLILPRGSRIKIDGSGACSLQLTLSR